MAFKKGEGGRPKGVRNKSTELVEARCRALIETESYQKYFAHRLEVGQLPPMLEALTWHYAYGKPVERQEHTGVGGGPIQVRWQR